MSNSSGSGFVPSVEGKSEGGICSSVFTVLWSFSLDHWITFVDFTLKWNPWRLKFSFLFLLAHHCCRMLEYGEYKGYLYGTSIDAVRTVLDEGKICVIDLEPQVSFNGAGTLFFISWEEKIILCTFLSYWNSVSCFVLSLVNKKLFSA